MSEGLSRWDTIRTVENYLQLPYGLTVAFNPTTSMVRIQLSGQKTTMSRDIGRLPASPSFPGLDMVEALRSHKVSLGGDMEVSIRENAFELVKLMDERNAGVDPLREDVLIPFFNRLAEHTYVQTCQAFAAVGNDGQLNQLPPRQLNLL